MGTAEALSRFSGFSSSEAPLRLAFALTGERMQAEQRQSSRAQELPTLRLNPQNRPLHAATLARLQGGDLKLSEAVQSNDESSPKKNETANADAARTWEIAPGDKTLNATFTRWSASAGWQLIWDLDVDYPIETRAVLQGTFEEAVAAVAESLSRASVPIQATFYAGNRVLRIVAKGSK